MRSPKTEPHGPGEEIILKAGAEGGHLALVGRRTADGGWEFAARVSDQSMSLIDEEAEPEVQEEQWVRRLSTALKQLDAYPWPRLFPLAVHPEFRTRILAAVRRRLGGREEDLAARTLDAWRTCGP